MASDRTDWNLAAYGLGWLGHDSHYESCDNEAAADRRARQLVRDGASSVVVTTQSGRIVFIVVRQRGRVLRRNSKR